MQGFDVPEERKMAKIAKIQDAEDLNLTPIMNVVLVLIPLMLRQSTAPAVRFLYSSERPLEFSPI